MKGRRISYSEEELFWIKTRCTQTRKKTHKRFCKLFSRDDISLANYNAICKRNGWFTGRTGCYQKGNLPDNKGKKMPYHPNSARTQFKKGMTPHNTKYEGHERISKEGYVEISIKETNPHTGFERRHVSKHKHLWEKVNGILPDGMCLKCIDGNRQNTEPNNWEAISRGALPFLNGHRGYNYDQAADDVKPTILALAKLKHARTNTRRKQSGR